MTRVGDDARQQGHGQGHGHDGGHGHDHGDPAAMRPVEEHAAAVAALVAPTGTETVPLAQARDRVLAQDLSSPIALPPFANSAMDGYAVRAADLGGLPVTLPVPEDVPAGRVDGPPLAAGTAHRIMTGAPLPDGADAVVQVEWTDGGLPGATVTVEKAVEVGQSVRGAGEDVAAGQIVLTAGTEL
jgi:molybdopterin molybdotransferase